MIKLNKLDKVFNPQTIAVIGASDREGSVGNSLMKNLLGNGYAGTVYSVNPKREIVHGIKAYPAIGAVPEKIDLAIIATPAETVPAIVEECGRAGVSGLIIISSGFDEVGADGHKISEEIKKIALNYGMRILGPNCLGFIHPSIHLNASFSNNMAMPGKISFISQSGALCTAILDWSLVNKVGFSHFVSIGETLDISYHDLIEYLNGDPETKAIIIYMESLKESKKFLRAAREFTKTKPIIVLKVGRTAAGAQAAKSHTGAITGNDDVYSAAFERAGIVRVSGAWDLFQMAKFLSMESFPENNRVAVITNAGGPGVIATDALSSRGGVLAKISDASTAELNQFLPANWSHNNPIDVLGDAGPDRYQKAVEVCLKDENVDAAAVILTPQEMTDPTATARDILAINNGKKTIVACWLGGDGMAEGRRILEDGNIPTFESPEEMMAMLLYAGKYIGLRRERKEKSAPCPEKFEPKFEANKRLIAQVVKEGRAAFTEAEAKRFLANYSIKGAKNGIAASEKEVGKVAAKVGYPLAIKILSPDILHKTDVGGVKVNIKNKAEAIAAYRAIMASVKKKAKGAKIEGVFIEAMTQKRFELLIGCKKDEVFGSAIVFGQGGIAVEVIRDTNIALPPLDMVGARRLIEGTKIAKLLAGYRGLPGVDMEALEFLLCKFSRLLADFPEIKELDINPYAIDEKGGAVLDAKIVID